MAEICKIPRRDFVKTLALGSLTILPGNKAFSSLFGLNDQDNVVKLMSKTAYRMLMPEILLDLDFYFINVIEFDKRAFLVPDPKKLNKPSFMIVRLPQQHIAESYFDVGDLAIDLGNLDKVPNLYAITHISGYSYLVFKIFFDTVPDSKIPLNKDSLLDWNATHFKLVVRQNLTKPIFELSTDVVADQTTLTLNDEKCENHFPLGYRDKKNNGGLKFAPDNFPKAYSTTEVPSPITAIEAPYHLILSPQLPDQDNYRFKWTFSKPPELWMATLSVEKKPLNFDCVDSPSVPAADLPEEMTLTGNDHMPLMILGSPDFRNEYYKSDQRIATCQLNDKSLLPGSHDKSDLVKLYIAYKLRARTSKMSFTPLGMSSDIEFKNANYKSSLQQYGISLFEWNQSISFGRDQKAEVSRVVLESSFGFKMLHIKKTKRETFRGGSILVYREFLMPLEIEKDYTLYKNDEGNQYGNPNWKCNSPFQKVEFADIGPKQIMSVSYLLQHVLDPNRKSPYVLLDNNVLDNNCYENVLGFWGLTPDGFFIEWPFLVTDWHGQVHTCKKKIFVYTSAVANTNSQAYPFPDLKTDIDPVIFAPMGAEATFDSVIKQVEDQLTAQKNGPTGNWVALLEMEGHFDLKKINYYTSQLDLILEVVEKKLRDNSQDIEDQVVEEWTVLKRKILEKETKLLRSLDQILDLIQSTQRTGADIVNIKNELLTEKNEILRLVEIGGPDLEMLIKAQIGKAIDSANKLILNFQMDEVKSYYAACNHLRDQLNGLRQNIAIGFEQDYKEFLDKLPGAFRNKIKNKIAQNINSLRSCIHLIRSLEDNIQQKMEFYKSSFGFAVYQVDEELEKVKAGLQAKLGSLWQTPYENVRKVYHDKVNAPLSAFQTNYIAISGNLRQGISQVENQANVKILDFFHDYASFPQMHSAEVFMKSVNDLVHKEIPLKIKYAQDYITTQISDTILDTKNNVSRAFAEIKSDAREYLKSSIKEINNELGGIVNPELAADYVTYLKDIRKEADATSNKVLNSLLAESQEMHDTVAQIALSQKAMEDELRSHIREVYSEYDQIQGQLDELVKYGQRSVALINQEAKEHYEQAKDWVQIQGSQYFNGLEAKIMGSIHLKDIIGVGFELPKLDRANNKVFYRFITDKLEPVKLGPFSFEPKTPQGKANLTVYFEKPLDRPSDFKSLTSLNNFSIGIYEERLLVEFKKLEIYSDSQTKNKVSVQIGDVHFEKELAFLEALSKNIKIPGTGLTLNISPDKISVDFAYTVPGISGGAFTFNNLKFSVGVIIPLPIGPSSSRLPVIAKFGINAPDDKFVVAAGIWGGKGHFVLEATPKYIRSIDAGIDFGGYFSLDLVIAKGEAYLMAGIRYVYQRDEMGGVGFQLYAILSCGGSVTVFGFITLSVSFLLYLVYQSYQGNTTLYGTATVTYSIRIGFFRKSFSLTFSRRLAGSESGSQNQTGLLSEPEHNNLENGYFRYAKQTDHYRKDKSQTRLNDRYSTTEWYRMIAVYKLTK